MKQWLKGLFVGLLVSLVLSPSVVRADAAASHLEAIRLTLGTINATLSNSSSNDGAVRLSLGNINLDTAATRLTLGSIQGTLLNLWTDTQATRLTLGQVQGTLVNIWTDTQATRLTLGTIQASMVNDWTNSQALRVSLNAFTNLQNTLNSIALTLNYVQRPAQGLGRTAVNFGTTLTTASTVGTTLFTPTGGKTFHLQWIFIDMTDLTAETVNWQVDDGTTIRLSGVLVGVGVTGGSKSYPLSFPQPVPFSTNCRIIFSIGNAVFGASGGGYEE